MNFLWAALIICLGLMGCGKTPAAKETAQVNSDTLTLQQANAVLAEPAGATLALTQPAVPPAPDAVAANMVENKDAGPLVDSFTSVAPADTEALSDAAAESTDNPDGAAIQNALKNLGLYTGAIDGKIGPKTKEAIREFQKKNNLTADGKVGPKTWVLLRKVESNS